MQHDYPQFVRLKDILTFITLLSISFLVISCKSDSSQETETTETEVDNTVATIQDNKSSNREEVVLPDTLKYCVKDESIGAGGYDLVNYFVSNAAELGSEDITTTYRGIDYRFIIAENKEKFNQDPDHFLPAYGGWCAMTLSMGRATTPVYDNFLIIEDRLHLFERTLSVNGKLLWQQDPQLNAQIALTNYEDYQDDGIIGAQSQ